MKRKTLAEQEKEDLKKEKERNRNFVYFMDNMGNLNISKRDVSRLCDVHIRTVERWEGKTRTVPHSVLNFMDVCLMCKNKYPLAWTMVKERFQLEERF